MRLQRFARISALAILLVAGEAVVAMSAERPATQPATSPTRPQDVPEVLLADERVRLSFGDETMVLPRGLQPSMLCTKSGALIVEAQVPDKPAPSKRITYLSAGALTISRDGGKSWTIVPPRAGENWLNLEGGAVQLRDGLIVAMDTYITPGASADQGMGQRFTSNDDWRTLNGPEDAVFDLPGINFYGSTDDGGHPHAAERLHRRIIEMPNGDLLTTFYGWMQGDNAPATYQPKMRKTRVMVARSSDRGLHWKLVSTVAVDPKVGTEGFDEPVVCRMSKGENAGRLICLMRTGRELYEATSDDQGATWSAATPRVFADLDVNRTELWVDQLRTFKDFHGTLLDENNPDELRGAVVDPDLIELRSGVLVAAFGVRVPQKLCWQHPEFPWNGNYLAFSLDHGKTWSHVERMTSGVLTTHYMAVEEMPTDNRLFVAYDLGGWSKGMRRDVWGRTVEVSAQLP